MSTCDKKLPVVWLPGVMILTAGLLVYLQVIGFDFVYFDDHEYIFQNQQVQQGLTKEGVVWAFTSFTSKHWHPLTWLSHMLDVELFGLEPWGHHLTNLILHLLTALFLFRFLFNTTNEKLSALLVALLFTIHPLHVENVSWIAGRKDLLCALFWIIALNAWSAYVERPRLWRYTVALFAFCLSILSKSMAITLPVTMLLVDLWPLKRSGHSLSQVATGGVSRNSRIGWLFIEKAPFFIIAVIIGLLSLNAVLSHPSYTTLKFSLPDRLMYGFFAYIVYPAKLIYPVNLITPYPLSPQVPFWIPAISGVSILIITVSAIHKSRIYPFLVAGWAWYLITLMPVAGFLRPLAIANRYAYIPVIGLYIILGWGFITIYRTWPRANKPIIVGITSAYVVLAFLAHIQVGYWKNTITLFEHTLAIDPDSPVAHNNIGVYLQHKGRLDQALQSHRKAVRLSPEKPEYQYNLGVVYLDKLDYEKALHHFTKAIELRPDYIAARNNRGFCFLNMEKLEDARRELEAVVSLHPDNFYAHKHLGRYYLMLGNHSAAETKLRKAISIDSEHSETAADLANILTGTGKLDEAEYYYNEAIRLAPATPHNYFRLAALLAHRQRFIAALELREKGLTLEPQNAEQQYFASVNAYFAEEFQRAAKHLSLAKSMGYQGIEKLFEEKLTQALCSYNHRPERAD